MTTFYCLTVASSFYDNRRLKKMTRNITNVSLVVGILLMLVSTTIVNASAEKSSVIRQNKSVSASLYAPLAALGLEVNYYLDADTQVGLVTGGDSIFVAGHVYACLHYTTFISNSFFIRTQAGYWSGIWGVSREGPATTLVFGHEWIANNFTWGIDYGGMGAVFDFKNGPDLAFSFPHLKAGFAF